MDNNIEELKVFWVFIKDGSEQINHIRIKALQYEIKNDYTTFYYSMGIAGLIKTESIIAIFDKAQTQLCGY